MGYLAKEEQMNDYQWFLDHLEVLYQEFGHRFLAIKDREVIGNYATYAEGVKKTAEKENLGSFIVQECTSNVEAFTGYIASMYFA